MIGQTVFYYYIVPNLIVGEKKRLLRDYCAARNLYTAVFCMDDIDTRILSRGDKDWLPRPIYTNRVRRIARPRPTWQGASSEEETFETRHLQNCWWKEQKQLDDLRLLRLKRERNLRAQRRTQLILLQAASRKNAELAVLIAESHKKANEAPPIISQGTEEHTSKSPGMKNEEQEEKKTDLEPLKSSADKTIKNPKEEVKVESVLCQVVITANSQQSGFDQEWDKNHKLEEVEMRTDNKEQVFKSPILSERATPLKQSLTNAKVSKPENPNSKSRRCINSDVKKTQRLDPQCPDGLSMSTMTRTQTQLGLDMEENRSISEEVRPNTIAEDEILATQKNKIKEKIKSILNLKVDKIFNWYPNEKINRSCEEITKGMIDLLERIDKLELSDCEDEECRSHRDSD